MALRRLSADTVVALFGLLAAGIFVAAILGGVLPLPLNPPPAPTSLPQLQTLMSIYASSDGCPLPCFWGFRPGQSSETDVITFTSTPFDYLALDRGYEIDYAFIQTGRDFYEPNFYIDFVIDDKGTLDLMEVVMRNVQAWLPGETYELAHVLAALGAPDDAYLSVRLSAGRVYLSLLYEEAGAIITYTFHLGQERATAEAPLRLCYGVEAIDSLLLRLQADDQRLRAARPSDALRNTIIPVEDLTGLDARAFTRYILAHPDECLPLLSLPEMAERGFHY